MLFGLVLFVITATSWIADPRSDWVLSALVVIGFLSLFILKTHERTNPFFIHQLWPRFFTCSAPAWIVLLQFVIGLTQNPLETISSEDSVFHILEPISTWSPTSAADRSTWIIIVGFSAAFILSSLLFIIPKSRSFFERIIPLFCLSAVLVAVFGYIQVGLQLESPLFTKGTGLADFFAFFPYDGHWAAFATLWCSCCFAMAWLSTRYNDSPAFIHSIGPWYVAGGILLGSTGLIVDAPIPAAVLLVTLAGMLLIFSVEFLIKSKDLHRTYIVIGSGISACLCFAAGIFKLTQKNDLSAYSTTFRNDAYEMFRANPIFGWGADSYEKIFPFFGSDELVGQHAERATSDLLQLLAEFGLFGLLIVISFITYFLIRYLRGQHNIRLTNHLLVGCLAVTILSAFDTPFMSPAVFFSFFVIFFSSMRWAELSSKKVDDIDTKILQYVVPESERRIPFFNEPYHEKEK